MRFSFSFGFGESFSDLAGFGQEDVEVAMAEDGLEDGCAEGLGDAPDRQERDRGCWVFRGEKPGNPG